MGRRPMTTTRLGCGAASTRLVHVHAVSPPELSPFRLILRLSDSRALSFQEPFAIADPECYSEWSLTS